MAERLPSFVAPMLARTGEPFDSSRHLFEVKWDGVRALAFVEAGRVRLMSRGGRELTRQFPELGALAGLPGGCILDGELVVMGVGKPDFAAVLSRTQAVRAADAAQAASTAPASYVSFDLLYQGFRPVLSEPLRRRRERLAAVLRRPPAGVVLSEGVVGEGRRFFRQAVERGLEGIVAKELDSPYTPGRRSAAWRKIKRALAAYCLIVGFLPKGERDFQSLLVASDEDGRLRYAGRVGTGFNAEERRRLNALLRARRRGTPLVPCPESEGRPQWVEPGLFCRVSFQERTAAGLLRAPVFEQLVEEGEEEGGELG